MSSVEAQGRLTWFWNRLRCMTPAEVLYRAQGAGRRRIARLLGGRHRPLEAADAAAAVNRWVRVPSGVDACVYAEEAARIGRGEVRLFSTAFYSVGRVPNWNRCPLTGVEAPAMPSHAISITNRDQVGDIKFVWELNRHLHWVTLAQAHALNGDEGALQVLGEQLGSWLAQCPPDTGPNWTSSLEYALRLINWAVVWQLIDGERSSLFDGAAGQELLRNWLESIQHHVLAIVEHFSRHSSANNHLIGELAGVCVGAITWPCWPRVRLLGERALREMEQQILLQTTDDGVNREQAFEYTGFVYDFFAVVERCTAVRGSPMSSVYLDRMAAMCCFIRSVMDAGGHVPQVGDADGAQVLRLHPDGEHAGFAAMLQKGAALFGRADWVAGLGDRGAAEARWMYAELDVSPAFTTRQPQLSFPQGGYELFEANAGSAQEIKGLLDVGPLGYLGIAAHGHADALQLCLSTGGQPLLVDPGTYSYWCDKAWRDYFRGTAAHNTVRVGEQDQSLSGGRFMWTRKAVVHGLRISRPNPSKGSLEISAEHDGYLALPSRFRHQRTVRFEAAEALVVVIDELQGTREDWVELHWHFHPAWRCSLQTGGVLLQCGDQWARLSVTSGDGSGDLELLRALESPPLGWYSDSYNNKQPCHVLRWRGRCRTARVMSRIELQLAAPS